MRQARGHDVSRPLYIYQLAVEIPDHPEMHRYNGCDSCGDGIPPGECNMSHRGCGHHCNHLDSHEECCWCGLETLGNGLAMTRCGTITLIS